MNLPKSTEMTQMLAHFIKEQVSRFRRTVTCCGNLDENLPEGVIKTDALQRYQRMIELKMPFTNDVFQALIHGAKTDGMSAISCKT